MASLVRFSEISQTKTFDINLIPSKEQIFQLVNRLDLLSLKKISLKGNLSPLDKNKWKLKAELKATVKQTCVITLKPVQTLVKETVNRTFSSLETQRSAEILDDGVSPVFFDDTIQVFSDTIDLFEIIFEELVLLLPLYPKLAGAKLGSYTITSPGKKPLTDENLKPFAQLSELKNKLKEDE